MSGMFGSRPARLVLALGVLSLGLQSCQPAPGASTGRFVLPAAPASLSIRVGEAVRGLQYLRVTDWEVAEGQLVRVGDPTAVQTVTAPAVVAPDGRGRSATLVFPQVAPGDGYTFTLSIKKRGDDGQLRVVGSLVQPGLTLTAGPNTLTLSTPPDARETPAIPGATGLGPYVSSLPGIGVRARLVSAQDVLPTGDGRYYFLDNGQLRLVYRDATGADHVRTVAGVDKQLGAGLIDGPGAVARFNNPRRLAAGPPGVLYVADAGSHAIRQVTIDDKGQATVSTLAGTGLAGATDGPGASATFNNPLDLVVDAQGDLWVADTDNHRIRKVVIAPTGATVSTVAGTGSAGYVDGAAGTAQFRSPGALVLGPDGDVVVGDSRNFRLRRLSPDASGQWTVSTLAGSGMQAGFQWDPADDDGPGSTARLGLITGVRRAPDGTLYVGDFMLRKVTFDASGQPTVSTLGVAGGVTSDFPRDALNEFASNGLAIDADGAILLASKGGIRRIVSDTGAVAIRRWVGEMNPSDKPFDGPVTTPELANEVWTLAVDADGNLVFSSRCAIYRLPATDLNASPTLIAGHPTQTGHLDGLGTSARFRFSKGLCLAPDGSLFVTDSDNYCVRKLERGADGQYTVSTVAGVAGTKGYRNGTANAALFGRPDLMAVDHLGNLYINDTDNAVIRKVAFDAGGQATVSTVAGREPTVQANGTVITAFPGYADGPAHSALLRPMALAADREGNLIVVDNYERLRKVTFSPVGPATVTTLAGAGGSTSSTPYVDGLGTSARFRFIGMPVVNRRGEVYVSDAQRIRKVAFDALGRAVVSTFLGGSTSGTSDGSSTQAQFAEFNTVVGALALGPTGDLFVTEIVSGAGTRPRIRRISSIP